VSDDPAHAVFAWNKRMRRLMDAAYLRAAGRSIDRLPFVRSACRVSAPVA
jgi:hypothetical protein